MDEQDISPQQVIDEALDFLRSKRDDNLDNFAKHATNITDAITQVEKELSGFLDAKRTKGLNKTEKNILTLRIAQHQDLKRRLKTAHSELSTRLSDFSDKTVGALTTSRIRSAAKNPSRRNIWKPALQKNLQKFPSTVQKKSISAKLEHTKAHWQPALEEMKAILIEPSVELQRDAAEKFIRKHQSSWAAKLSGDQQYRTELLDVFLVALESLVQTNSK